MYIYIYIVLVSVPALSCRLGHVAYDCAFGAPIGLHKKVNRKKSMCRIRTVDLRVLRASVCGCGFDRNVYEVFSQNPLQPGIEGAADGKVERLETCNNKLREAR